MALLHRLVALLPSSVTARPGCWPRAWDLLLHKLSSLNIVLPQSTLSDLIPAAHAALTAQRALVARLQRELRQARHKRWLASLPTLWKERPGVIFHWLHSSGAPWGTTPILDERGAQCLTVAEVDGAVRRYWVDEVLRCHASVDGGRCWSTFFSRFGQFIPTLVWPILPWDADRVRAVLGRMRERAAPGSLGIPLAVWKSLPTSWHGVVGRLLSLVEDEGVWPTEWATAYVSMIPKSSGGSRPRDQRPITVLDLVYRIWAKGVVLAWAPVLQQSYLGQAAMGFRAGAGVLHLAQLLSDLMILQKRRGRQLWLASFDVQKCYDSLPWWAISGSCGTQVLGTGW